MDLLVPLMAIVHERKPRLPGWKLGTARSGTRGDAARALYVLVAMIDRQQRIEGLTTPVRACLARRSARCHQQKINSTRTRDQEQDPSTPRHATPRHATGWYGYLGAGDAVATPVSWFTASGRI
ncbi:hypothetical protein [Rhodococcus sp. DMU1]|uniref:hypothetical protein n=1 Tax=Rhodococcus sp. DMU1 TaxID=2722825 RepID=UPI00143E35DE|nr:hypothetical protein [Rhodococcus sp. DMU1]QIX53821.1 hypothetical protein HFP48_30005 [Rhodococcus sp. DMU1]